MSVVSNTPTVDSMTPGIKMGRMSFHLVSIPPLNKMIHNATVPMFCASEMLWNWMPKPSLPNSIPAKRNINKVGIPNRYPVLLIRMLQKIRNEPTSKPISNVIFIDVCLYDFPNAKKLRFLEISASF